MIKINLKNQLIIKIMESFIGTGSYTIFSLLFSFICTRLYGAKIFGEYTYAFTIVTIVSLVSKAGMDNGLMYYIPKVKNKYVSLSFILNFVFALTLSGGIYVFTKNFNLKILIPLSIFLSSEQLFFAIYRSEHKIKEYYFINAFLAMIVRIFLVLALYFFFGRKIENIIYSIYLSVFLSLMVYYTKTRFKFQKVIFNIEFIQYSFPLMLVVTMGLMMNKIDILMLGNMSDSYSLGVYQICTQLSVLTSMVLVIFNTSFAPKISQLYHQGEIDELRNLYINSTRIICFVSSIIILLMCLFSKYILLIFGQEFVVGQKALIIRAIGQFVNSSVGSAGLVLSMTGKPKLQTVGIFLSCIVNIGLNYILIPRYGIDGAAFASMLAMSLVNILDYLFLKKELGVKVYNIF